MRRCFEQLLSRRQFRNSQPTSCLSSFKSDLGQSHVLRKPSHASFSTLRLRLAAASHRHNHFHHAPFSSRGGDTRADTKCGHRAGLPPQNRRNEETRSSAPPEYWATALDRYLPRGLSQLDLAEARTIPTGKSVFEHVLRVLLRACEQSDLDVLAFMVLNQRRYKATVYLVDVLLKSVALTTDEPFPDELPSNINWPAESFAKRDGRPIELERGLHISRRPSGNSLQSLDNGALENDYDVAMQAIWSMLARLVTASSRKAPGEGKKIMHTVHQILARVHELGLVPAKIYSHHPPRETTTIQQPPTLHILSSRILSTLSDAVWHAYQDEVTSRSTKVDKAPWYFLPEPPGSPLRSKGRELGPEVWVEFILWCCVEAGFASTGAQIIKSLREDVEDSSWRAVRWPDATVLPTDWNRITRLEDYPAVGSDTHRDEPLATNLHKVISAEVVLAITDGLISNLDVQTAGIGLSISEALHELQDLVSFLGPDSLTPAYLDYLAVRLLQTELFCGSDKAPLLRQWGSVVNHLRDQHPAEEMQRHDPGLDLDFILDRSELRAGLLHQSLQSCVEDNLVKKAVDTYTQIQKTVDGNKLRAIGEFLSLSLRPQHGFFTSRLGRGHNEFLNSYGQLTTYKVTPFLDLLSSAKLFGLAEWLLFSDDVDGAVLPPRTWEQPSVAAALTRYATATGDPALLQRVRSKFTGSDRKMTVNVLRALVIGYIHARQWDNAARLLQELRFSDGGGYSPMIVANLAATILRLELDPDVLLQNDSNSDLRQAMSLLSTLLDGFYNTSPGTFRIDQKKTFRKQVGYFFRLLENVSGCILADMAIKFRSMFPVSNKANMASDTFNVIYAAIIETRGALEGRAIWYLFCRDPRNSAAATESLYHDDDETTFNTDGTDYDWDGFVPLHADNLLDKNVAMPANTDRELLVSSATHEHIKSDELVERSGASSHDRTAPTPLAYPAALNIDTGLHQDPFSFANSSSTPPSETYPDSAEISIESAVVDSIEDPPELTPIVDPDVRTLQILVRGALAEIQARKEHKRSYADLEELLRWAEKFYAAFNLAQEDIRTEFRASPSLPHVIKVSAKGQDTSRRTKHRVRARERSRPDVSRPFSEGATITRLPGIQRVQEHASQIFGESQGVKHDGGGTRKEEDAANEAKEPQSRRAPQFKVRKFETISR